MSGQWRGLHNPERHEHDGAVAKCMIETANPVMARWCTPDHPCRCCMDQEARNLAAEVEVLRAQVQRVREACDHERCYGEYGRDAEVVAAVPVHVVLRALDGGERDV